jgi:hypothetical protein
MAKKVIRLTEGDLHRIIKESVNKVLTEMDWKTYANAAKKEGDYTGIYDWKNKRYYGQEGEPERLKHVERQKKFADAAKKAFDKDYAVNNSRGSYGSDYYVGSTDYAYDYDPNPNYPMSRYSVNSHGPLIKNFSDTMNYDGKHYNKYPMGNSFYNTGDNYTEKRPDAFDKNMNLDQRAKMIKGDDEIKNYRNGNYEYQKGKGWQKKQ